MVIWISVIILIYLCIKINLLMNDMKELSIAKVNFPEITSAELVPGILDQCHIPFQEIACVNWKDYPYQPAVRFRAAHTGDAILLNYRITEKSVRAVASEDNGSVWEDACAEFFIQLPGDKKENYYNFECNCAGKLLVGYGKQGDRTHAGSEPLAGVKRWSSLGNQPFEERMGECSWELALVIPASSFFAHQLKDFSHMEATGNFYKCGDKLETPHFLSWAPIDLPAPCFHCPDFFGKLHFE